VFGILDYAVRKRLLRDPELTLQTAIENVRSAELTNAQLKQTKSKNVSKNFLTPIVNCDIVNKNTQGTKISARQM
jgi:hypothetical protein